MRPPTDRQSAAPFTPYQKLVVAALAFLQFAVILDFMIVAPLGALVMPALDMRHRLGHHPGVGTGRRPSHGVGRLPVESGYCG